ncbi:MAG: ATP12 family chaperone protein [Paracoccaceae bacterium]
MIGDLSKRFWKDVTVQPQPDGFSICLDQRTLSTPAKAKLLVPTRALADQIAAEWDVQVEKIDPGTMPFTRMANAAIDKVRKQKAEVSELLLDYGDSDLLCYRAEFPAGLVARQNEAWNPLLDWAEVAYGVRLETRVGVMHQPQNPEHLTVLSHIVNEFSDFELAAFHDLVSLSGSLIIGLAAMVKSQPAESLWIASRVDELWQHERWGDDEEAEIASQIKKMSFLNASIFAEKAK